MHELRRIPSLHNKKDDKAVAAVIGATLLVAMGVTLFASFTLWYVPTVTSSNEQISFTNQESAFSSLSEQVQNYVYPGKMVSQAVSLGFKGAPPFTSNSGSTLSFINSTQEFSALLNISYCVELKVTKTTPTGPSLGSLIYINITRSYNATGFFRSQISSSSGIAHEIYFADGTSFGLVGNYSQSYTSLPIDMHLSENSDLVNISLYAISLIGDNLSVSQFGTSIISLQAINTTLADYSLSQNITILDADLTPFNAVVQNITISELNYTFVGSLSSMLNVLFYRSYSGLAGSAMSAWGFYQFPFSAKLTENGYGNTLLISLNSPLSPEFFSLVLTNYKVMGV